MARCSVCSEKAYVNPCAHCDKKCCDDCREAHCDILKREISRVNNQVKRGWHRLEDCVQQVSSIYLSKHSIATIASILYYGKHAILGNRETEVIIDIYLKSN